MSDNPVSKELKFLMVLAEHRMLSVSQLMVLA